MIKIFILDFSKYNLSLENFKNKSRLIFRELIYLYSKGKINYFYVGDYGKKYINKHIDFNISYSYPISVLIISDNKVGIDIEEISDFSDEVAKKIMTQNEYSYYTFCENKRDYFYLIWTLKEALLKAEGYGLNYPLKEIEFIILKQKIDVYKEGERYVKFILSSFLYKNKYRISVAYEYK